MLQSDAEKIISPIDGNKHFFYHKDEKTNLESYLCMTSGYTSTSLFVKGSESCKSALESSPPLVVELQKYDPERNLIWLPVVLNMGKMGIIWPEGTKTKWYWKYAEMVDIPTEEQQKYPIAGKDGEYYKNRLDVENAMTYESNQFLQACIDMGVIKDIYYNKDGTVAEEVDTSDSIGTVEDLGDA